MSQSIDQLYRFGLKLFVDAGASLDGTACIPVFHRWIQTSALDRLLIDVADYTHLRTGPNVLLVGHEGNLSVDTAQDRQGLLCTCKRPGAEPLAPRLAEVARTLLTAGRLLEADATFDGRLHFATGQLQFVSNDRLIAPPGDHSVAALTPALRDLMTRLYPDESHSIVSATSSTDRLTIDLTVKSSAPLITLLERIS